jgi:integrase/recombinase XerC
VNEQTVWRSTSARSSELAPASDAASPIPTNSDVLTDSITLAEALNRYYGDLEIGKSPASVRTYRAALGRFTEFMSTTPGPRRSPGTSGEDDTVAVLRMPVSMLTTEHPVEFLRWLIKANALTPKSTLATYTTAVTRFYAFLVREDIRPDLPLARMQLRLTALKGKKPKPLPRVPTDSVVEAIVRAARAVPGTPTDPAHERIRLRNIALVEALRGSGMRVSEAVGLRRGDLDREHHAARVLGKGSKERIVLFSDAAWHAMESYLAVRLDGGSGRGLAGLPVFARHDRGAGTRVAPLSTKAVRQIVSDLARRAEVDGMAITPHRFRAWFATHLVAETGDLAAAQDLLGHESANTTRIYTKVANTQLRDVHRRAFDVRPSDSRPPD